MESPGDPERRLKSAIGRAVAAYTKINGSASIDDISHFISDKFRPGAEEIKRQITLMGSSIIQSGSNYKHIETVQAMENMQVVPRNEQKPKGKVQVQSDVNGTPQQCAYNFYGSPVFVIQDSSKLPDHHCNKEVTIVEGNRRVRIEQRTENDEVNACEVESYGLEPKTKEDLSDGSVNPTNNLSGIQQIIGVAEPESNLQDRDKSAKRLNLQDKERCMLH